MLNKELGDLLEKKASNKIGPVEFAVRAGCLLKQADMNGVTLDVDARVLNDTPNAPGIYGQVHSHSGTPIKNKIGFGGKLKGFVMKHPILAGLGGLAAVTGVGKTLFGGNDNDRNFTG